MKKIRNDFAMLFSYIELKHFIVIALMIFIGVTPTIFSPSNNYNFWNRLLDTLTSRINVIFLILVIIVNMVNLSKDLKSSNIILRYKNYEEYLQMYLRITILSSLIIILINSIFCVIGVVIITSIMGNFDFSLIMHEMYDFPLYIYLLFFEIRKILFILLLTTIIYFIFQGTNSKITLLVTVSLLSTFFIDTNYPLIVNDLTNIPIIVTRYFSNIAYSNIFLELSCTLIQFILLCIIIYIEKYIILKRKNELI